MLVLRMMGVSRATMLWMESTLVLLLLFSLQPTSTLDADDNKNNRVNAHVRSVFYQLLLITAVPPYGDITL